MPYILLTFAIGMEILATTLLKFSEGFTKICPTVGCALAYLLCYTAFSKAVTKMNLGIAYATWCGVGILITTLISVLVFREKITTPTMIGCVLVAVGCVILNMTKS